MEQSSAAPEATLISSAITSSSFSEASTGGSTDKTNQFWKNGISRTYSNKIVPPKYTTVSQARNVRLSPVIFQSRGE